MRSVQHARSLVIVQISKIMADDGDDGNAGCRDSHGHVKLSMDIVIVSLDTVID
jgi:hypothetical protein